MTIFRYNDIIILGDLMNINEILIKKGITKYRLAKLSGVPNATLSELCSGKTNIEKCSAETLYKISKVLNISMEKLIENSLREKELKASIEKSYECGLPSYLQNDLDVYKNALKNKSPLIDCYWGELYGSINMAEINDGAITSEHADYLRKKYLWS